MVWPMRCAAIVNSFPNSPEPSKSIFIFYFLAETACDLSVHGPYVVLICVRDRGGILVVKRRDKADSRPL
jgi:hypothetical protein